MGKQDMESLKRSLDIVAEIQKRGVVLKQQGKEWKGLCPFHQEQTPSFSVNPQKGVWNCLGCHQGGDLIDFIRKKEGVDFTTAVGSLVRENPQHTQSSVKEPVETNNTSNPLDPASEKDALGVISFYERALKNNPPALRYLQSRGLTHPELLQTFRIGFSDHSLPKTLPRTYQGKIPVIRQHLMSWGILREDGVEHLRNCLTFPIFTTEGH
ncbi:CHC2 zinc finger domain-containing protein, partial [Deltaproteobacteria bacterium TL4]